MDVPEPKSDAEIADILRGFGPWGEWALARIEWMEGAARIAHEQAMENGGRALRYRQTLEQAHAKLSQVVEPWLGVRGDIIPRSVEQIVPLCNDLHSTLADNSEANHG